MSAEELQVENNENFAADTVENNFVEAEPENGVKIDEVQSEEPQPQQKEDDDNRKIFVGGLSWETTEGELKTYFETYGTVLTAIIKIDKMGNSRGFGFVTFESEDSISKVLETSEHKLKNKKIDPKPAKPTRTPIKKIFVGGLSPDVTEEQIKEFFTKYGVVESVDLPFDNAKGKRKPYVFLSFTTEEAAKNAISDEKQDVCGSKCDVRMAVPKDQVSQNKMGAWNPYAGGAGYPGGDYYSYEYPYGAPYGYDPNSYYSGYYSGYPYGYSYPMPPHTYGHPGAMRGAPGGKVRGRGGPAFHPYSRPQ